MDDEVQADGAAYPTLSEDDVQRLRAFGEVVEVDDGGFLFVEGQASYDFIVILQGAARSASSPATRRGGSSVSSAC